MDILIRLGNSNKGMSPRSLEQCIQASSAPFSYGEQSYSFQHQEGQSSISPKWNASNTSHYGRSAGPTTGAQKRSSILLPMSNLWKLNSPTSPYVGQHEQYLRTGIINIREMISPSSNNIINRAFRAATGFNSTNLSFGNCDYYKPSSLTPITLYKPSDPYSNTKGGWAAKIGRMLDEGWRVCYTDGTGRQGHAASAVTSEDRRGNPNTNAYSDLGEEATVVRAS